MSQGVAIQWRGCSTMMRTDTLNTGMPVGFVLTIAVVVLCWVFLMTGAGTGMNIWAMTTLQLPPYQGSSMVSVDWTAGYAMRMVVMWWVMMLAMMLPGVLLATALHATSIRLSTGFLIIYGTAWLGFSVLATALQLIFETAGWLNAMRMWSKSVALSYALLAVAAGTQFPLLVQALHQTTAEHERGLQSASHFTVRCLISTAPVMLLLFVGGVMNLFWIVGLSIWAALQKSRLRPFWAPSSAILFCLFIGASIYLKSTR